MTLGDFIAERFWGDLQSSRQKDRVEDLTPEETAAICYFACVPYRFDLKESKIIFAPCGIIKRDGIWTAIVAP